MKKILCVLSIIFLLSLMFVPLVSASYICPAAYTLESPVGVALVSVHPSTNTYASAHGMVFTTNSSAYLYNVTFQLSKYGSPTNDLEAVLYSISGTVGTTGKPDTALAISSVVEASSLNATKENVTFTFDGTYLLANATDYAIGVVVSSSGCNIGNYAISYYNTTSDDASMNRFYFASNIFTAHVDDAYFIINGDTATSGATPTPVPTSTGGGDADMEALVDAILPWLVPLLICLIPALLGYKFVGELGFFIGLNVGCILAYVTLAGTAYAFPLWGIILVGVMDVAVVLMRR